MLPSENYQTTMNKKDTLEMLAMIENSIELVLKDIKNLKKSLSPKGIKKKAITPRYEHYESVSLFLENCCERTNARHLWPITTHFYDSYVEFCNVTNVKHPVSYISFFCVMRQIDPNIKKLRTSLNGRGVRKFTNITLKKRS